MKSIFCLFLLCISSLMVAAGVSNVTLGWDINCDPSTVGYTVYYGSTNDVPYQRAVPSFVDSCGKFQIGSTNSVFGVYTNTVSVVGQSNATVVVSNLIIGVQYAFVLVSFNANNIESDFSAELVYLVPPKTTTTGPSAPTNLRFK